jgi:hypothetical protein
MTIGSWVWRNGGRHRAGDRPRRHRSLHDCRGKWPDPAQTPRACGSVQVTGEHLWAVAPRWNVRGFSVIRATEGTPTYLVKRGNENRPRRLVLSALRVAIANFWRVGATPSDLGGSSCVGTHSERSGCRFHVLEVTATRTTFRRHFGRILAGSSTGWNPRPIWASSSAEFGFYFQRLESGRSKMALVLHPRSNGQLGPVWSSERWQIDRNLAASSPREIRQRRGGGERSLLAVTSPRENNGRTGRRSGQVVVQSQRREADLRLSPGGVAHVHADRQLIGFRGCIDLG